MEIRKLNPVGYEAKTEKGNTYKKSNLVATGAMASMALIDATPYIFKNSAKAQKIASFLSMGELFKSFMKTSSPALKGVLFAAGVALDLACGLWLGHEIDKFINKKRANKADEAAQQQMQVDTNA